jgi:predicted Zn-dependent peptidase
MPNRRERPPIQPLQPLHLPEIPSFRLDNGIEVYVVNQGTQEVIKVEVLFEAGRPYEHKPLVSRVTGALLREGSRHYPSGQIAEHLDYFGSSLKATVDMDCPSLVLYTLNKHLPQVLPVFRDLILEPTFLELEMLHFIERQCQNMEVELSKPEVQAYRAITEQLFGESHPYGYNSTSQLFWDLNRQDVIRHYERCYLPTSSKIIISGCVGERELDLLKKALSDWKADTTPPRAQVPPVSSTPQSVMLEIPDAAQTAYRMGINLVERGHPDYPGLYVANTLLGGYFGSRLMTNIREDKGYTYNIYSAVDCMRFGGCWLISSEVGNEFSLETRQEVLAEIECLHRELVPEEELSMLKSYLQGVFLGMLDGPFNIARVVKQLLLANLPLSSFDDWINQVQEIDSERLRDLFQHYLQPKAVTEVWVGPEKSLKRVK